MSGWLSRKAGGAAALSCRTIYYLNFRARQEETMPDQLNDTHADDPAFQQEQAHLSELYAQLLKIRDDISQDLDTNHAGAKQDLIDMSEEVRLDFGGADETIETLAAIETLNAVIDAYNQYHDFNVDKLRRVMLLLMQPYFAKVTLEMRPGRPPRDVYIGAAGMTDERSRPLVVDWRSPVAETYYNQEIGPTSYQVDGKTRTVNLKLRRQFDIVRDQLNMYFDTTIAIQDSLLLSALKKHHTEKLQAITATIQREQNEVVRHADVPVLLVNGIAGSGKTSVLLQRIAYLLYQERKTLDPSQVWLFTPNDVFESYIDTVLPSMGESNPQTVTWRDFVAAQGADTPLWFFWTLQQLEPQIGAKALWERYGETMKQILEAYREGVAGRVILNENGLVWASCESQPMTWMDAMIDGKPVTPRNGYQVEVNALWYNALCYTLKLAAENGDKKFVKAWEKLPEKTKAAFNELFTLPEGYLADYIGFEGPAREIRPNMIIACGLPFKMIDEQTQLAVIQTVRQHLLTPKGLRTLSPRNPLYKGSQEGSPRERQFSAKNGSVWTWLLEFYVQACFDINGDSFLPEAEEILENFNEDIQTYGIGSIGELFDADPPYSPRGAISQAWSVGAVLDIYAMIQERKARMAAEPKKKSTRKTTAKTAKEQEAPAPRKTTAKTAAKAAAKTTAKESVKKTEEVKEAKTAEAKPAKKTTRKAATKKTAAK